MLTLPAGRPAEGRRERTGRMLALNPGLTIAALRPTTVSFDPEGSKIKAILTAKPHALAVAIAFGSCCARVAANGGYPDVVAVRQFLQRRARRWVAFLCCVTADGFPTRDATGGSAFLLPLEPVKPRMRGPGRTGTDTDEVGAATSRPRRCARKRVSCSGRSSNLVQNRGCDGRNGGLQGFQSIGMINCWSSNTSMRDSQL
jgi:hypothetical protein